MYIIVHVTVKQKVVGMNLATRCFSHCQPYVCCSRVGCRDNQLPLCVCMHMMTENIVYPVQGLCNEANPRLTSKARQTPDSAHDNKSVRHTNLTVQLLQRAYIPLPSRSKILKIKSQRNADWYHGWGSSAKHRL